VAIRDRERQATALNSTCSSVNSSPPGQYSSTCEMMREAIKGGHQAQSEAIIETVIEHHLKPLRALEARNQLAIRGTMYSRCELLKLVISWMQKG